MNERLFLRRVSVVLGLGAAAAAVTTSFVDQVDDVDDDMKFHEPGRHRVPTSVRGTAADACTSMP